MIIRLVVSTATLVGLALTLAAPAEAAKKQKKSYIYYSAEDRAYFQRVRQSNRLVVRPRSYLSAGTATKQYDEHYADYAFPPGSSFDYSQRNTAQGSFNRQPLPEPYDIPGWTKF
ncbi:MAG: hypothetical protein ACXWJW_02870 [Xanthobacteraceae bacterium]